MKNAFRTNDGYILHPVNGQWTDGVLTFENHPGRNLPIDCNGELLDGVTIDS